jgi:GT2 family glycosyltransferase
VVLQTKPSSTCKNFGRARNEGWRATRARLIVFNHDDCYPAHDYLPRIQAAFADATVGFVGGRVLLHDESDAPVTIKTLVEDQYAEPGDFIPAGWIHGANMAFRREVLLRINGFDRVFSRQIEALGHPNDVAIGISTSGNSPNIPGW